VKVKVLRFTPETGKMSLGLKQLADDPWSDSQERFAPGTKHKGKVVSMTDYGAFVEIAPGVEGLLHISEMSWDRRLKSPSQVLSLGAEIEVVILQLDATNRKLRLGTKQLTANPWADFVSKNPVGTKLKGSVRSLTDFGAFVSLAEHIDGLLHISELSWTVRFRSPSELLRKGEEVEAVLIKADPEQERLSLSLKQRYPDPWEKILQQYPVGRSVQVTVKRVLRPGLLVEVEPGVEGFVSWRELPDPVANQKGEAAKPKEEPKQEAKTAEGAEAERTEARHARDEAKAKLYKEGDSLTVQVIHVNPSEHKFRLSARDIVSSEEKENYIEYMAQNAAEQKGATSKLGELLKEALEKAPEEAEKRE
jgi:small subunit ribosomal protein S1